MAVRVVIPWRAGCPYRQAALSRVASWWVNHHPDWDLRIGEYPPDQGDWCKSLAIATAGPFADDDVIIVADADVICEQIGAAVDQLCTNDHRWLWAMPHRTVYRLTEHATSSVVDHSWWPGDVATRRELQSSILRQYPGYHGGGLVVTYGRILNTIPMDPRFRGWGQEDHSWALSLLMLAGVPWRGHGSLWHLWHPPAPRIQPGVGSLDSRILWHRYRAATNPVAMRALVDEAREELDRLLALSLVGDALAPPAKSG